MSLGPTRPARLSSFVTHSFVFRTGRFQLPVTNGKFRSHSCCTTHIVYPSVKVVIWIWSFLGAFAGVTTLYMLFGRSKYFQARGVPPIIAPFAASAVLCFGAIEAPFSQPRNLVGGHLLASIVGVSMHKLFALLPRDKCEDLRWLSSSVSCALAIIGMDMLDVTHPPSGAIALLASSDDRIVAIGWLYIPVVLISSLVLVSVALMVNNIQRQYPTYWIGPTKPSDPKRGDKTRSETPVLSDTQSLAPSQATRAHTTPTLNKLEMGQSVTNMSIPSIPAPAKIDGALRRSGGVGMIKTWLQGCCSALTPEI
ncbi:HPP family-domain-containing protein [Auriculariales sp. MPI-PUGE-AT-0066]|nr:HPP family-domain-containing protein [Auriculariales sp. MPI-PUGE-AT-0066]